jgi:hypothetical protein
MATRSHNMTQNEGFLFLQHIFGRCLTKIPNSSANKIKKNPSKPCSHLDCRIAPPGSPSKTHLSRPRPDPTSHTYPINMQQNTRPLPSNPNPPIPPPPSPPPPPLLFPGSDPKPPRAPRHCHLPPILLSLLLRCSNSVGPWCLQIWESRAPSCLRELLL